MEGDVVEELLQKTSFQIGCGNHTNLPLAEPAIAIAGEDGVNPVANRPRNDKECGGEPPWKAERRDNSECSRRLRELAAVFEQDDTLTASRRSRSGYQARRCLGLKRRERKLRPRVASDDELDESVAQIANSVEQNHRRRRRMRLHPLYRRKLVPEFFFFRFQIPACRV